MKAKCLSCQFYTRWEQASGGSIARCNRRPEVEEMIRTELRLWNVCGNWASTWEADERPSVPGEEGVEPEYVFEELDRDLEAAIQEWLDSCLIRLEHTGPVYRSVNSIEKDILWKFASCREYVEMGEEEAWDDPVLYSHYAPDRDMETEFSDETAGISELLIGEIDQLRTTAESNVLVPCGCP